MTDAAGRLLFEPRDSGWLRGPAHQEGEHIVLDRARATAYRPSDEPLLPYQLVRIATPSDAIRFVHRFGLVGRHPYLSPDAPEDRQPFRDFRLAAKWIRELIEVAARWMAATRAPRSSSKRRDALIELRQWALSAPSPLIYQGDVAMGTLSSRQMLISHSAEARQRLATDDDNDFLDGVTSWLAEALSAHTALIPHRIGIGTRHQLRHEYDRGHTLVDTACLHIADWLVDQKELRQCDACQHFFPLYDQRQQFCNSTCASRARKRRLRAEQPRQRPAASKRRLA